MFYLSQNVKDHIKPCNQYMEEAKVWLSKAAAG